MILVFGATGQVARELKSQVRDLVCLGRNEVDLQSPDLVSRAIEEIAPTAVINAAAYTDVERAEKEEKIAELVNGRAPREMALACDKFSIPFVHISSDYVFDGSGELPFDERETPRPLQAYGRTKLLGEVGVQECGRRYVILRTSWVISSHGNNFLKTMLRLSKNRSTVEVVCDQFGGPTPAEEIAKACVEILSQLSLDIGKSGIYHFAGEPDVSWSELAQFIFDESSADTKVEPIPSHRYKTLADRPKNSRLCCTKLNEAFGLARPDWRCGVSEILGNLKDQSHD